MKNKIESAIVLGLALGFPAVAAAGPKTPIAEDLASNPGDWCEWLQSKPGTLYKNKENPYIQEFQIEGRFQYQYGHVDGNDLNGVDYDEDYDEARRVRLGVKAKFLQYFGLKYQVNMALDTRPSLPNGELDWGYFDMDEAYLTFDLAKAFGNTGFDKLSLVYGRQKFLFGTESHTSSTKLYTIERSALANKVYGSYRPTGLTLKGERGAWQFAASAYSSSRDGLLNKELNGWQDSYSVLFNLAYQASDELLLRGDFTYNDAERGEDTIMAYKWALAFGAEYDADSWGVNADFIYGDNGDASNIVVPDRRGNFYGFQVTPWMWLVEDKLQLVGQYQYQGSDNDAGIRINSRYGRRLTGPGISNAGGRGDSHHSVYAGLNYYLCGHNTKIQAGLEYQTLDAARGDFDTLTYLLAFRMYF